MAWTAPKTWTVGDVLTASDMNTYQRDNVKWLGTDRPSFRLSNSATQNINNATVTQLSFDTEDWDNGGCCSGGVFTVPSGAGGKWLFIGTVNYPSNSTGNRQLMITTSGTSQRWAQVVMGAVNGDSTRIVTSYILSLSAADNVYLVGYQTSGGALTIPADTATGGRTTFAGYWLAT